MTDTLFLIYGKSNSDLIWPKVNYRPEIFAPRSRYGIANSGLWPGFDQSGCLPHRVSPRESEEDCP